jgi:hypothetical protein
LPETVAVQPDGAEAPVGIEGKKNEPGTQEYQTLPIGDVAAGSSVKAKL